MTKVSTKPREKTKGNSFEGARTGGGSKRINIKRSDNNRRMTDDKARRRRKSDRNTVKKVAQHAKRARKNAKSGAR